MTPIAKQYGQALYDLCREEAMCEAVLQELNVLQNSFRENPDYIRLLSTPSLPKQERCQILDSAFAGKLQPYVLNFLKILTEHGYMGHFDGCCQCYTQLYNRDNGILVVTATTASPLEDPQKKRLCQALETKTGKRIQLINKVDAQTLGGMRLEYDGKCVDDTLAHRLDEIGKLLKNTVI